MKKMLVWVMFVVLAGVLCAQSVVDVAAKTKKENEGKKPAKVYTNQDMSSSKGHVSSSTLPKAKEPDAAGGEAAPTEEDINKEWEEKLANKRQEIEDLQRKVEIGNLDTQKARNEYFSNPVGTYSNTELKERWDTTYKNWQDTQEKLAKAKQEYQDLETQARKAGVPAKTRRKSAEAAPKD